MLKLIAAGLIFAAGGVAGGSARNFNSGVERYLQRQTHALIVRCVTTWSQQSSPTDRPPRPLEVACDLTYRVR